MEDANEDRASTHPPGPLDAQATSLPDDHGWESSTSGQVASSMLKALSGPYHLVVMQPTTLCNADCTYCYLPFRDRHHLMLVEVAEAVAEGVADQNADAPVTILWHCGEPLAAGLEHFERLLAPFEALRESGRVTHRVQTNATLIDDDWCELLLRYEISVGISIDGPAVLNDANRVDWKGQGIFDRVMRGVRRLRAHQIPFNVIAVVSPETIVRSTELFAFMDELGPTSLAINIEELELANATRLEVSRDQAENFWRALLEHLGSESELRIRELTALASYLASPGDGTGVARPRESGPTVSWDGDVVVLALELLGAHAPEYDDFVVGNVSRTPLKDIMAHIGEAVYVREFAVGLANCRASCSLWDFCQGAHASSRYFEHGNFTATETAFCRNSRQAPATALLSTIRRQPPNPARRALAGTLANLTASPG